MLDEHGSPGRRQDNSSVVEVKEVVSSSSVVEVVDVSVDEVEDVLVVDVDVSVVIEVEI